METSTSKIKSILTEREIIEKAKKQPEFFRLLYEKHHEEIFRFIYRKVGDKDNTADVVSEVFLKALVGLKRYKITGVPFIAWLYRIAINEANAFFRSTKKERLVVLESKMVSNIKEDIKDEIEISETSNILKKAIHKLKPIEVELIELRFFHEKQYKEIALITELSESNAKVKIHRALAKLKGTLKYLKA